MRKFPIVEPRLLEHRLGQEGRPFTRKSPVTLEAAVRLMISIITSDDWVMPIKAIVVLSLGLVLALASLRLAEATAGENP
jgi:hypothetical protein